MKLIDPSYTIIDQQDGLEGMFKHIELCGRTCYKSEDKITENSAESFVQRMIDSNHTAMLEHATVYFYIKREMENGVNINDPFEIDFDTIFCKYGKHNTNYETHEVFFTTNLRWLVEKYPNDWKEIYKYYSRTPDDRWPRRRTVKLTTSLHVYKDVTRHRTMSFAIESTRFCNYSKGKFGSELTFVVPVWCDKKEIDNYGKYHVVDRAKTLESAFMATLNKIENEYIYLTEHGWQAQQAAEILPQCVKGDVIMTGFESDWEFIFRLRALGETGAPHPEVKRIFEPLMKEFIKNEYISDITSSSNDDNPDDNSTGHTGSKQWKEEKINNSTIDQSETN